jgi:Rieske Fe-S protein
MLAGVGLTGLAGAVSACGLIGGDAGNGAPAATTAAPPVSAPPAGALGAISEIPVGGGKVFASAKVVVTQPSAGQFKGYSAICTHQQCTVDQVSNGTIDCPCHGSQFSVKDGSVVSGPAPSPLPAAQIKITGTSIELG